jgi:hypothetical protein
MIATHLGHIAHLAPVLRPAPLMYGDPTFKAMTDLAHRIVQFGRTRGVLGALIRHPNVILPVLLAAWRLPVIHLTIHPSQAVAWFVLQFPPVARPIFGGRRAQAVLDLAPDDDNYLAGRRKQALRTNLSHARQEGLHGKRVATYDEWSVAAHEVLRSRGGGPELELIQQMQPPSGLQDVGYYAVVDQEGRSVAYSVAAIFNDSAVLTCMLSVPQHPAASAARYLLHTLMRSDLRTRGVRYLIVGTAVAISPGLQYFQYLLGYEVRNLHITVRKPVEPVHSSDLATV